MVWMRFSANIQTGPGAHPASHTMGNRSLSWGVKQLGQGVDHPPPSSAEMKERVDLYNYSLIGTSWVVLGYSKVNKEPPTNSRHQKSDILQVT
jgi:hypothetical protein